MTGLVGHVILEMRGFAKGRALQDSVRILLVDDFQPFRRVVRLMLEQYAEYEVVGEAGDAPEAVWKSEELKPDLVLLDVSLPSESGINAMRKIRAVSPNSTILCVSEDSRSETVREALRTGARGYVIKSQAANDLMLALEAVAQGEWFVSHGVIMSADTR